MLPPTPGVVRGKLGATCIRVSRGQGAGGLPGTVRASAGHRAGSTPRPRLARGPIGRLHRSTRRWPSGEAEAALTSSAARGRFTPVVAGCRAGRFWVLDLSCFGERPDTEGKPDGRDHAPPPDPSAPLCDATSSGAPGSTGPRPKRRRSAVDPTHGRLRVADHRPGARGEARWAPTRGRPTHAYREPRRF